MKKNYLLLITILSISKIYSSDLEDEPTNNPYAITIEPATDPNDEFEQVCNKWIKLVSELEEKRYESIITLSKYIDAIRISTEIDGLIPKLKKYIPENAINYEIAMRKRIIAALKKNVVKCRYCNEELNNFYKCLCKKAYFCDHLCKNKDFKHQKCIRQI